jgi:hypothetical protein
MPISRILLNDQIVCLHMGHIITVIGRLLFKTMQLVNC